MSKIALKIEYNGANYHGLQKQQADLPTIAHYLEQAISKVANHQIEVIFAGRTDKGVHASAQVAHFISDAKRSLKAWHMGINSNLPHDISVSFVNQVNDDFHARFSALARRYRYVIYRAFHRPALLQKQITWQPKPLNIDDMRKAAIYLVGEHDFSSLRGADCQAHSPIRTIYHLDLITCGDWLIIDIKANAFLQHMVRNIAGLLMTIGQGIKPISFVKEVLESKHRNHQFSTAAADGLYLVDVIYPERFGLNNQQIGPYFLANI